MKVTDYIALFLRSKNVRLFFGFQGGAVTPLIDSMSQHGLQYIQSLHEQAGGFAADGYARVAGGLSVAIATNGPGATNFVSAIANANLDSTPCLFITGQVNVSDIKKSTVIRQNGFQEVDTVSIVKPITKYAVTVKGPQQIPFELHKAVFIATTGRKGAVLLDIPLDVLMGKIDGAYEEFIPPPEKRINFSADVDKVLALLSKAEKPVCVIGGGVRLSCAVTELQTFLGITGMPSVSTAMGLDVFSETDCGFCGLYGRTCANLALYRADVILVFGSRLAKRQFGKDVSKYAPHAKFIQIDVDKNELSRVVCADIAIHADAKAFLQSLNAKAVRLNISKWQNDLAYLKQRYAENVYVNPGRLDPVRFVEVVSSFSPDNVIVTADVGQNQMWVAQGWKLKKGQRVLMSGGLGCMGFSLPAAIGASFAAPKAQILAFMGDGGLQMNIQELQTVAYYQMPVKVIVFNNKSLGMIQEMQHKYFGDRYVGTKTAYSVPDLKRLARAYGIPYTSICEMRECDSLPAFLDGDGPGLVEVRLEQNPTRVLSRYDENSLYQKR